MRTRHAGRQLVRQHEYAGIITFSESGEFRTLQGWLDPEVAWLPVGSGAKKSGYFCVDFGAFSRKKGTKTPKNGPVQVTDKLTM
jgi:hypothetical protein